LIELTFLSNKSVESVSLQQ